MHCVYAMAQLATKTRSCTSRENKMAYSCASSFNVNLYLCEEAALQENTFYFNGLQLSGDP